MMRRKKNRSTVDKSNENKFLLFIKQYKEQIEKEKNSRNDMKVTNGFPTRQSSQLGARRRMIGSLKQAEYSIYKGNMNSS